MDEVKPGSRDGHLKIISLGDSAVGKSKLVERFLMGKFQPQQLSTYALTLFEYSTSVGDVDVDVDIWDTAGQERFQSVHPSYYHRAHACILVFDVTRMVTYQNLSKWYKELREYGEHIPVIVCANKIDVDYRSTKRTYNFASKRNLPLVFASAADGTNVVNLFEKAIEIGMEYQRNPPKGDLEDILDYLDEEDTGKEES